MFTFQISTAGQTKWFHFEAFITTGLKNYVIIKLLKFCRTVNNVWENSQKEETTSRNSISGRKRSVLSRNFFQSVKKCVNKSSRKSMRNKIKEIHIADRSLRRIVKEDCGRGPYRIQERRLLSGASK